MSIATISEVVVRPLGYRRLRKEQRIDFVSGNDMFAILPTDLVKPYVLFIYLPFLMFRWKLKAGSIVVVISPTITAQA